MKALLPIAPSPAPSAPSDSAPHREPEGEAESFASVLDRCHPASPWPAASGETSGEDAEPVTAESSEVTSDVVEVESDENPIPQPLGLPTLALPLLPYQPIITPSVGWPRVASDTPAPESSDEGPVATVDAGVRPAQPSAQSAAPISAAPRPGVTIFAAPNAEVTAVLPAAGTESLTIRGAGPAAQFLPPTRATEPRHAGIAKIAEHTASVPPVAIGTVDAVPTLEVGEAAPIDQVRPVEIPASRVEIRGRAPGRFTTPLVPQPRELPSAHAEQPTVESSGVVATPSAVKDDAGTPAESTPPLDGTPAAKRGEVMPSVAIPTPAKPRVARSAQDFAATAEPVETRPVGAVGETIVTPEHHDVLLQPVVETAKSKPVEQRSMPDPTVALPAANRPAFLQPRVTGAEPAATTEPVTRREVEAPKAASPELRVDLGAPTHFPTTSPDTERAQPEIVTPDAPISRAELVRIVERTAEAAVRIRATGSERIEVALQLESGDRLTIQLQFANGEVTPHFRTNSDGLRTALEQHWSQFTERASDRGVRLTPPVFDVNSSSSNMTDLSQQRHGRDTAYAEAQAELFPHLPRRMRPPRVLAAAPSETAASTGVRAYA